jgi:hypothetical protein
VLAAMHADAGLLWEVSELPVDRAFRTLTLVICDPSLRNYLPIERERIDIEQAIRAHQFVAIQAATSSGKTMKIPEFMLDVLNPGSPNRKWPILVVRQSYSV